MARVIAVASAKGGVGKTTTTMALGTTLAAAGHHVVAVDADLGMANLGTALGIETDTDDATIHDVLAGRADVSDATYEGPNGLSVVPGDTDLTAFPEADPTNLRTVLTAFDDADYVLLDTGAGLSHDTVLPLGLADDVLLVTDTDPNAVGDTEKTRQVAERLGGTVTGVVVTRVDSDDADELTSLEALDASVLAAIPVGPLLTESTAAHSHFAPDAPSAVATAYRQLARELTGEEIPELSVDVEMSAMGDSVDTADAAADETRSQTDESTGSETSRDEAVESVESAESTESTGSDETLVPDAEVEPTSEEVPAAGPSEGVAEGETSDDADGGVYTTPLVDEAETTETTTDSDTAGATEPAIDDSNEEPDDADDEKRTGFLSRLLG